MVNLGQSLWLDEAISALVAWDLGVKEIINNFIRGDFHPPGHYLLLHFWGKIFGWSEISLRLPSVFFGVGTIYFVYKIINELTNSKIKGLKEWRIKKMGLTGAVFLATSQFHIYYSQEARMYAMATFFASLSMYFFIKIINELTNSRINGLGVGYFFSTLCLLYTDYYGFLVLLSQIIAGLMIFRKNLNFYISKSLYLYISIFLLYLPWLPIFWEQIRVGFRATEVLPGWGGLVNLSFWKALPLTFLKFSLGRITIFNKIFYAAVTGVLFLIYGFVIVKGFFRGKKLLITDYQLLIALWLIVPIFFAWLLSLFIPNYQPFRLILVLPAFWILLAWGMFRIKSTKIGNILICLVLMVNLVSLGVYWFNPYFWREDWRGVADFLKKENLPIIISSSTFNWPLVYYGVEEKIIGVSDGVRMVGEEDKIDLISRLNQAEEKKVAYTSYLADLYDPPRKIPNWLKEAGFVKIKEVSFNQILIEKWERD